MFLYPGHKYLGPGNPAKNGDPVDIDDYIAQQHDEAYEQAKTKEDIFNADKQSASEFWTDFKANWNHHSLLGATGLTAKNLLEEKILGAAIYPSMPAAGDKRKILEADTPNKKSMPNIPGYEDVPASSDVAAAEPMQQDGPAANRSGSGPGVGSVGANAVASPSIFTGKPLSGSTFNRTYSTCTRWILPACKTAWRTYITREPTDSDSADGLGTIFYKIGGSALVPWHLMVMYMSPYEYYEIRRNYVKLVIKNVNVKVTSLGTRAPYSTNTSNIEVANSNLQSPLVDYFGINEHIDTTIHEGVGDIAAKMIGTPVQLGNDVFKNKDYDTSFPNISARMETRVWTQRLIIQQHLPLYKTADSQIKTLPEGYVHSFPNILQHYHKMINASNHLGVSFDHTMELGTMFYHRGDHNSTVYNDKQYISSGNMKMNPETVGPLRKEFQKIQENFTLQGSILPMSVENAGVIGTHNTAKTIHMPVFAFGHYLLRNITTDLDTDVSTTAWNNIVDLNHEFMLECTMNCEITLNIPIYYNPSLAPDTHHYGVQFRHYLAYKTKTVQEPRNAEGGQVAYHLLVDQDNYNGARRATLSYAGTTLKKPEEGIPKN